MGNLPQVSGRAVVKALGKIGYYHTRQKGSHIQLNHEFLRPITVPNHKNLRKGTLRFIIRAAELSIGEFIVLL